MRTDPNRATDVRTAGVEGAAAESAPNGRRLIDARQCAAKIGASVRHWLRICDRGLAPWGVKVGALRRWDEWVVNRWIADGCPVVRSSRKRARV